MDRGSPEGEPLKPALALAEEAPLVLAVDGEALALLMCTPLDLDELAAGHLRSRGLVSRREDLRSLRVCPDRGRVDVELSPEARDRALGLGLLGKPGRGRLEPIPSACGAGMDLLAAPGAPRRVESGFALGLEELAAPFREMFARAELYRATGGMHCAALATFAAAGEAPRLLGLEVREDVGRHNAVDKVLGRALLDNLAAGDSVLLTSGRVAADMVLKAVAAGVPILVSRSIPTSAAYALALEAGIAVVGRMGSSEPSIYTHPERIRSSPSGG